MTTVSSAKEQLCFCLLLSPSRKKGLKAVTGNVLTTQNSVCNVQYEAVQKLPLNQWSTEYKKGEKTHNNS